MGHERDRAKALLITGVYGTGKSSVAAEIAYLLDGRGVPYAALDLDWLGWFNRGHDVASSPFDLMLDNLDCVVRNYFGAGIKRFVLARSVGDRSQLRSLEARLGMPVTVVRLTVPIDEIERRLEADATTERRDDLREAQQWLAASIGAGIEDLTLANEGPIRAVAEEILDRIGW